MIKPEVTGMSGGLHAATGTVTGMGGLGGSGSKQITINPIGTLSSVVVRQNGCDPTTGGRRPRRSVWPGGRPSRLPRAWRQAIGFTE